MMPKTLKVTASNLEAYRLWRQFDFIPTEELFARIRGEKTPQTFEAQLGNAYHAFVLNPDRANWQDWDDYNDYIGTSEGIDFDNRTAKDALGDLLLPGATFEVWGRRYFSNFWAGHTVYFVTRMDAMFGNEIIDLKVSLKSKDPVTRLDSLQWSLYCMAAHCRKFTYIDVQLRRIQAGFGHDTHYITVAAKPLTLYLSDSIERDLKLAVVDYLEFVKSAGLLDFIDDAKKN